MFGRRKTSFNRLAWPTIAMIVAAGAAWYFYAPAFPISTAQAHDGQPASMTMMAAYRGKLRHGGIPLEYLRNAETRLDTAPVRNSHGDPVGIVQDVVVGRGGRPELVRVAFGGMWGIGTKVISLKADTLGYDPRHNTVLTDMTVPEFEVIVARRDKPSD